MSRRLVLPIAVLALLLAAPALASFTPTPGHYKGSSPHHGPYPVSFRLADGTVENWVLDNRIRMPAAHVSTHDHSFAVGLLPAHHRLEGHWTDARHVVGIYSYRRESRGRSVTVEIHWVASLAG